MIFTNRYNLPEAFVRAVRNDPYSKGASDFSATGLLQPARAIVLTERHGDEIKVDVSTRVAATIGQGVHSILERAQRPGIDIIETRYFSDFVVSGQKFAVSAQVDLYESDTQILYDWKTTKAFAFHAKAGAKFEYEAQLNIGALLMSLNQMSVKHLKIIGLLKDWDYKKAKSEPGYPPTEVMTLDINDWPAAETTNYVASRVAAIVAARKVLPRCTSKETWGGDRCARWCDVASVCTQYQESKKTGLLNGTN